MKLSQKEMNLVYPQTNPNWANEVGTTFFAEEVDLNSAGWLDPWSRPLSKDGWSEYKEDASGRKQWWYKTQTVYLTYKNVECQVELYLYKKV